MILIAERNPEKGQSLLIQNEKADNSAFEHLVDYTSRANGAFRTLQTIQKTTKLGNEIAKEAGLAPSATFKELERNAGIGAAALGFARLPGATSAAIKSLAALKEDDGVDMSRKATKAFADTTDAISAYGYTTSFVTGNPVIRTFSQAVELTSDLADLQLSVSDHNKASSLEAVATGPAKEALSHSKKHFLLRIIKDVASIATAILSFTLLAIGAPLMPSIALIIIFMSTTLFAIIRDMHRDSGKYKVINFDRDVKLVTV